MKRKIYEKLVELKNNTSKKPIMLLGARQVGKTYIIREFCKANYKNFLEINLFKDVQFVNLYRQNISSEEKFQKLKVLLNTDLDEKDTILFIDEIQESEELISELKFFCEEHNNVNIICAGSLLGIKLKRNKKSFPVGKVWRINMYPMDFEEYLWAFSEYALIDEIKKCFNDNKPMIEPLHHKILEYYRKYLISGGLPESVQNMVDIKGDIIKYNKDILNSIIDSYFDDMNKYVDSHTESIRIQNIYNSIPNQLGNNSHKFQYTKIDYNARTREYESPLDWLLANNLVIKSTAVSKPAIPLKLYTCNDIFKIYLNDVGLLNNLLEVKYADIIMDNLGELKGIITENYVANQLLSNENTLYYWLSMGTAEIDFVVYNNDGIIPIEVKSGDNTQSKSLKVYINKYKPKYAIRVSTKNFGFDTKNKIKSIPLYAVFLIK